jgi:NADH-quinone oxidoreductase subunit C
VTTPSDAPDSFPNGTSDNGEKDVVGVRRGMFGPTGSGDTSGYGRLVREVAMPGSSPRPYGGYFDEVVDGLAAVLGQDAFEAAIERVVVHRDQLTLEVRRRRCATTPACVSS